MQRSIVIGGERRAPLYTQREGAATASGEGAVPAPRSETLRVKSLELLVEKILLGARWILVIFLLGLGVALALYAVSFLIKLANVALNVRLYDEHDMILAMLRLIDAALVASLIVMVMISSYENFVSRFTSKTTKLAFLGKLDSGNLKLKVASSIVAISSIHLLGVFMNLEHYENGKVMWFMALHLTFVVSAVLAGLVERIGVKVKDESTAEAKSE